MALVTCPDCGAQVSGAAPSCPKCGRPFGNAWAGQAVLVKQQMGCWTTGCLTFLGVSIVAAIVFYIAHRLASP